MSDTKFIKGEEITAVKLNRIVDRLPSIEPGGRPGRQFCALFFTPENGIPERDGDDVGEAMCQRVAIVGSTLTKATNQLERVRNISVSPVGGERYIQCLWIDGDWIANWEDCEFLEGSSSS